MLTLFLVARVLTHRIRHETLIADLNPLTALSVHCVESITLFIKRTNTFTLPLSTHGGFNITGAVLFVDLTYILTSDALLLYLSAYSFICKTFNELIILKTSVNWVRDTLSQLRAEILRTKVSLSPQFYVSRVYGKQG